jgi:hypothetical protein
MVQIVAGGEVSAGKANKTIWRGWFHGQHFGLKVAQQRVVCPEKPVPKIREIVICSLVTVQVKSNPGKGQPGECNEA